MRKRFQGYADIVEWQLTEYIQRIGDPDSSIAWNIQGFTERNIDDLCSVSYLFFNLEVRNARVNWKWYKRV
jgi:hypothetical protein